MKVKVRVRVKVKNGSRVEREDVLTRIPRAKRVAEGDALDIMGTILFQAVLGLRRGIVL